MKKTINQQGSAMAVAVVCLVIALLFALGWIFWQNFIFKQPANKETGVSVTKQKTKSTKGDSAEPKDVTSDWLLYENSTKGYSVRLPDGWIISHESSYGGSGWLVSRGYNGETPNIGNQGKASSVVLKPGTKAVVQETGGPGECHGCRFVLQQRDDNNLTGYTARASTKTKQGNSVDRYEQTVGEGGSFSGERGTKIYAYHVRAQAGTKDIRVDYNVRPGESDIVETVDLLVESIRFG